MIRMKISRVDHDNNDTPILSKNEIENFAHSILTDYKPHLLKEPGAIKFQHFLENYLGVSLLFRDIYYDDPESPIFGMTIFRDCTVQMFDRENERVKHEIIRKNSIIIDNYVMEPGREGFANFTGIHEGGHYLIHPGVYSTFKPGQICCRRENLEGSGKAAIQGMYYNQWIEFQANYFTACFTMPNTTFRPLVNDYLRKHDIWKGSITLGLNEDSDILGRHLLPEYVSEVYGVSKRAAFSKLKTNGFIVV